jgi:hypothetical protein
MALGCHLRGWVAMEHADSTAGPELFDYLRDLLIDVVDQDPRRVHIPPSNPELAAG